MTRAERERGEGATGGDGFPGARIWVVSPTCAEFGLTLELFQERNRRPGYSRSFWGVLSSLVRFFAQPRPTIPFLCFPFFRCAPRSLSPGGWLGAGTTVYDLVARVAVRKRAVTCLISFAVERRLEGTSGPNWQGQRGGRSLSFCPRGKSAMRSGRGRRGAACRRPTDGSRTGLRYRKMGYAPAVRAESTPRQPRQRACGATRAATASGLRQAKQAKGLQDRGLAACRERI